MPHYEKFMMCAHPHCHRANTRSVRFYKTPSQDLKVNILAIDLHYKRKVTNKIGKTIKFFFFYSF